MATQQLSQVAEAPLSKAADAHPSFRPHLVRVDISRDSTEHELTSRGFFDDGGPVLSPDPTRFPGVHEAPIPVFARAGRFASRAPARWLREAVKRSVDIVGGIALGLVFLPLMLIVVLLLRNEGGPVIYRHRRVGRNGRSFDCLKFRTMVPDAERKLRELLELHPELKAEWLRDHKLRNDPRITALGRFLRRTSLDELPQIWNVLRGDMSLVGPRPIVREEMMRYGRSLPVYLSAKPGITGLWQVTGRNDTDYRRRVAIDVYYVRKRSVLLDLYILFKTARVVLGGGGAY